LEKPITFIGGEMSETKNKKAVITSQGWVLKKGEHSTISAPRDTNCDGIVNLFRSMARNPRELRDTAFLAFSQCNGRLFIRIEVRSQDTRSEKFVDAVTKGILRICNE
jgi:hypothetical protein